MVALGTSLTGSREAGDELAQEAMLRAYRGVAARSARWTGPARGSAAC